MWKSCPLRTLKPGTYLTEASCRTFKTGTNLKMKTWPGFKAMPVESFWNEKREQSTQQLRRPGRDVGSGRGHTEQTLRAGGVRGVMDALCVRAQTFPSTSLATAGPCEPAGLGGGWPFVPHLRRQWHQIWWAIGAFREASFYVPMFFIKAC